MYNMAAEHHQILHKQYQPFHQIVFRLRKNCFCLNDQQHLQDGISKGQYPQEVLFTKIYLFKVA